MKIDVVVVPGELDRVDAAGTTAVVIDVLRATSTITTALANGSDSIIPCHSVEEAVSLAKGYSKGDYLLAGERKALKIDGFHLGNSPREFTGDVVSGKKILLCTTNGTTTIRAMSAARRMFVGSFLNASAVADRCVREGDDVVLVCSGRVGRLSYEDMLCAGMMAGKIAERVGAECTFTDSAKAAIALYASAKDDIRNAIASTDHGSYLISLGFEQDIDVCTTVDAYDIVPEIFDRTLIRVS